MLQQKHLTGSQSRSLKLCRLGVNLIKVMINYANFFIIRPETLLSHMYCKRSIRLQPVKIAKLNYNAFIINKTRETCYIFIFLFVFINLQ
jgi:hypothetical protein